MVNQMLDSWRELTEHYGCTLTNLAINWIAMHAASIHVLCGARKLYQMDDSAKSRNVLLRQEDFLRMKADADALIARCV